ncbi:MAG: MFS transporter [Chlamydiales bacterium]|nr:MFS transporter [Chlamydiales bacterium]
MIFFKKQKKNKNNLSELKGPAMSYKERHALLFLNITQFLGALNDNVFKFLAVFLLIDLKGVANSGEILFWIGIVYVLPFLLFSSSGGIFADRFSKQKIIIFMKGFEILVMIGALVAFYFQSPLGVYVALFFLSTHSAFFGPPKYSIIPEIVETESITKANGIITSSTYLAIILGSFLASFVTQITNKNFLLTAIFCLFIAVTGFISSLFIPPTDAQRQKQKITPFFIRDIYKTLQFCKNYKFFLLAMSGSLFFLFIGAFLQLNIVPFAIESLGLSEIGGGYLFLSSSIGIALGAVVAGRTSQKSGNLGLSCLAIGITATFFFLIPVCTFSIIATLICLALLGFGGGMFIVPIDSFIQTYSPDEKRGKIVATSNFLSFCGVLLAPICIYLFSSILHLSAATGFFIMGIITLAYFCVIARKLSGIFLNYASRKLLHPFFHIDIAPADFDIKSITSLVVPTAHTSYAALIMGIRTKFHLHIAKPKAQFFDRFWNLFKNIHFIYFEKTPAFVLESFQRTIKLNKDPTIIPCLIVSPSNHPGNIYKEKDFLSLKTALQSSCQFMLIKESHRSRKKWAFLWQPVQITFDFNMKNRSVAYEQKHLLKNIFSKN